MADSSYIDALYNAKKNAANNSLKQRQEQQLGEIQTQETQDTADFNTAVPQYQIQRNQADATGFQNEQDIAERMAQTGNYSGGTMNSNLARERQATSNNRATVTSQENTFRQSFAHQMNALRSRRTQANNAFAGDMAASDQSIGAELTAAKMQWQEQENAKQQQLAAQRASASRASASRSRASAARKPSATATAKQSKEAAQVEASRQISAAIQGGMVPSQIQENINANSATFKEAGLSISALNAEAYRAYQDYHKSNAGYTPM